VHVQISDSSQATPSAICRDLNCSLNSVCDHQVRHGETVYGLSRKYGVAMDRLLAANPSLRSPDLIHVGSALMVPVLLYHRNPPPASLSLSLRELNSPRTRATFDLVPNYGTSSTQKVSTPRRRPVLRVLPDANVFPTKPYTGSFLTSGLEVVPKNGSSRESRPSPKRSVIAKASMQVSETTVSETSTQSVSPARDLNVALDIVSTSKAMVTAAIAHVREDVIKKGVNTIQYFKEQRQRYTPTEHNIFTKVFYFVNVRTPLVIRSDIDKQLAIVLAIATKQMRQPAGKAFQEVVCNMHNIKTQAGKSATRLMMRTPLERDKKIMKVIAETDMTIESIASKHGISVPRLQQLNRMDDDVLKVRIYGFKPRRLFTPVVIVFGMCKSHVVFGGLSRE